MKWWRSGWWCADAMWWELEVKIDAMWCYVMLCDALCNEVMSTTIRSKKNPMKCFWWYASDVDDFQTKCKDVRMVRWGTTRMYANTRVQTWYGAMTVFIEVGSWMHGWMKEHGYKENFIGYQECFAWSRVVEVLPLAITNASGKHNNRTRVT